MAYIGLDAAIKKNIVAPNSEKTEERQLGSEMDSSRGLTQFIRDHTLPVRGDEKASEIRSVSDHRVGVVSL